ncbi:hypothetical protein [Chloracidobacterium aggregatum]|nr:hypothetical protein [Chloracidobacterium aggregatum]
MMLPRLCRLDEIQRLAVGLFQQRQREIGQQRAANPDGQGAVE